LPCFKPLKAWRSATVNQNGKRPLTFRRKDAYVDLAVTVPCGQCIGCRLERSRQWAIRCVHEAQMHQSNSFITLTYNEKNIPDDGSLDVRHFQLFMKRLRKKIGCPIRYYHCGEYGASLGRPHYHAIIFGYDFPDKRVWKTTKKKSQEIKLYRSAELEQIWQYGYSSIGDVTFESAAYVARYIMKKITGEDAASHYQGKKPEYTTMSRRPGLAKNWYDRFECDVYPSDFVVMRGQKMRPPKYYDNLYEIVSPADFVRLKQKRKANAEKHVDNNTNDRLLVREAVTKQKMKRLPRSLE